MTALVFNCNYNGLSIIQELGRRGVKVLALDNVRSVGTFSRYGRYRRCPDPQTDEDGFISYLLGLGPSFDDKPVLFPTHDHWAVAISRYKEALSKYYIPCVADYSTIELIVHKQRFYEWGLARGIPVPRSWKYEQLEAIPDHVFPLAAKPEYRRISSNNPAMSQRANELDRLRLTVLRNRADLKRFTLQHHDLLPYFLFQEYVEGLSDCMYTIGVYANREHKVLGLFTGRKIRGFPPDIGDCIIGQVEEMPVYLKEWVKQICIDIKYHGIAEFEFKRDSVTGEFKLIEINPRSWSWVGITPACGVSLPWIAYEDLTTSGSSLYKESNAITGSIKWVKISADLPSWLFPEWHLTPLQWAKSLRAKKVVIADIFPDDPLPTLYSLYYLFSEGPGYLIDWLKKRRGASKRMF